MPGVITMEDEPDDRSDARMTDTDVPASDGRGPREAEWVQVSQAPFDEGSSDELAVTIIELVADAEGISPRDVKSPPLYDTVDAAALEAAYFGPERRVQAGESTASTEFLYRGFRIVVQSNGWVRLYEQVE